MKILQSLNRYSRAEPFLSAALIILTAALTYRLLIPGLGYYRAVDYLVLSRLPLGWHLYALFLKIIGILGFLFLARMLWPDKKLETTFAALLFTVYPRFLQQPNANTFQNHLFGYASAIFSIVLTVMALCSARRWGKVAVTLAAVALALSYFFIYEYMIGLEGVCLAVIAFVIWSDQKTDARTITLRSIFMDIPYALTPGVFLAWRLFIFKSARPATDVGMLVGGYTSMPLHSLALLALETGKDIIETVVFAWVVLFYLLTVQAGLREMVTSLAVALLVCGLAALYLRLALKSVDRSPVVGGTGGDIFWMGALAVTLAIIPIELPGRNVLFSIFNGTCKHCRPHLVLRCWRPVSFLISCAGASAG